MKKTCNINDCFSVLECTEFLLLQHFADGNHILLFPGLGQIKGTEVSQGIRKEITEVIDDLRDAIKKSGFINE